MAKWESLTEDRSPMVIALLVFVAAVVAGAVLGALGFTFIGILVGVGGIPAALVAWIAAN